jgi:RNA polymerase sigma-70 factor (ECF subfamily)
MTDRFARSRRPVSGPARRRALCETPTDAPSGFLRTRILASATSGPYGGTWWRLEQAVEAWLADVGSTSRRCLGFNELAGLSMLTPDQRLIERITQGDGDALGEFYDRHAPRVFGILLRLLSSRDDAEDVLQESFWQIWRTAPQYDVDRSSPEAWLLTIARSRAMDCLRRRPRTVELPIEDTASIFDELGESLDRQESRRQLRTAIDTLPAEQRAAIMAAFFEGRTHVQIAEHFAIPLGTVKTRIALGMKRLRRMLRPSQKEGAR